MTLALTTSKRYVRSIIAGLLEPPPAMLETIWEWVRAQVAANNLASAERILINAQSYREQHSPEYDELRVALDNLESNPTSYKAFKAAHDIALSKFGYGVNIPYREFIKLDAVKTEQLKRRVDAFLQYARERIENNLDFGERGLLEAQERIKNLRKYTRPGVHPMTEETVRKKFPVDLSGWKYGDAEIRERAKARATKEIQQSLSLLEERYDKVTPTSQSLLDDIIKDMRINLEKAGKRWDSISVDLTLKPSPIAAAHWQPLQRLVTIVIPTNAEPHTIDRLYQSLQHELQHMAQDILAFALSSGDSPSMYMPRRPGPGLPSRHIMTPKLMQQLEPGRENELPQTPQVQDAIREVRQQRVNPRFLHDLDDVEFYTQLTSVIDDFKRRLQRTGRLDRKQMLSAIKLFTGEDINPNNRHDDTDEWYAAWEAIGGYQTLKGFADPDRFFVALKRHAPGKWQKAVKELVKAVL